VAADGEPIAAMTRTADHWLTNAAQGGTVEEFHVDEEVRDLVASASDAVGGGLLGVDLMETGDSYTVHEVNHTVEFKALDSCTDVDVPAAAVDWLEARVDARTAATASGSSPAEGSR
jgi:[lysine-biosynthesis-protein LysW]--L-2-aminoadipate ligase